ncbi:hypothetical protein [Nitrosophilus labii]|uniref:hypothetical protein n=1 Tax=Nitrosophilus labii TaxID=2706014 RepID=UPI001656CE39|nr:hypothetical protein [Nitrosophilus labii]
MKKIILGFIVLFIVAIVAFIVLKGKDTYDPSKFYVEVEGKMEPGAKIDLKLPDQFDKTHTLDDDTKVIIAVFTKDAAHKVIDFLKKEPKGYLESKNAQFIADISKMPVIIRNTFALPDLQKSDYTILLIYDENLSKKFHNNKNTDKIFVIFLDNKKIKDIKYAADEKELKEILK